VLSSVLSFKACPILSKRLPNSDPVCSARQSAHIVQQNREEHTERFIVEGVLDLSVSIAAIKGQSSNVFSV